MSKPICVFQSPIFTRSGYGDWALSIAKSLVRYNKFDLKLIPTRWGSCSKKNLIDEIDPVLHPLILKQQLSRQPEVFIQCTIPNEFQTPAKYNIGITAGIETTIPRGEWVEGMNKMNMNFVLSKHVYDVFSKVSFTKTNPTGQQELIKIQKPMEILNWGADTSTYYKTDKGAPEVDEFMSKIPEEFAFLHVGQWTSGGLYNDRKDIGNLIKTFLLTFKGLKNKPCLIVKTSGAAICEMDKFDIIAKFKEIENQVKGQEGDSADIPNVYLLYGELNDVEMNALFNHKKVKAHVSFTHGEGGGHPILLATLSGKPTITPEWSGHLDYLNKDYATFFKGELKQVSPDAVNEWIIKESMWFYVNYESASEKMKNVFHHYGSHLENAEKLRVENINKFSEISIDKIFHTMLGTYVPQFAVSQKIILPRLKKITPPKIDS